MSKEKPIEIPRLHFDVFNKTSVGLKRVAEQLEACAEYTRTHRTSRADADEIAMWGEVLEGLAKKLDETIEAFKAEPDQATIARALERNRAGA